MAKSSDHHHKRTTMEWEIEEDRRFIINENRNKIGKMLSIRIFDKNYCTQIRAPINPIKLLFCHRKTMLKRVSRFGRLSFISPHWVHIIFWLMLGLHVPWNLACALLLDWFYIHINMRNGIRDHKRNSMLFALLLVCL